MLDTYSGIIVDDLQPSMAFMLLPFGLGALSYIYYHKTQRQLQENQLHDDSPILHGQLNKG